jgi:hypothetical protein
MPVLNLTDQAIAAGLSKLVDDRLVAGTSVIVEPENFDETPYYVQFAFDSGLLWCEAASEYLEPPNVLDGEQLRALGALGFRPPEHEEQNWFQTLQPTSPEDYDEIVALVHRTFRDVYRLPEHTSLRVKMSWDGQALPLDSNLEFASEGHRSTFALLRRCAGELFAEDALSYADDRPAVYMRQGSTMLAAEVVPIEIHSSFVELYSYLVRDIDVTEELCRYLLAANAELPFGSFAIWRENVVLFRHRLLGDTLDEYQLTLVLGALAELADEWDDEIVASFGGRRAMDGVG